MNNEQYFVDLSLNRSNNRAMASSAVPIRDKNATQVKVRSADCTMALFSICHLSTTYVHQIRFPLGLCPRPPLGELTALSQT